MTSTSKSSSMAFVLRPLHEPDIDPCAHVAGLAFMEDRQTQFKAASPTNPYDHTEGMKGALRYWLHNPWIEVTVAVANEGSSGDEEILGWAAWGFRGFGAEHPSTELNVAAVRGIAPPPEPSLLDPAAGKSARDRLEEYTSADLHTFVEKLVKPGSKCMIVSSIVVHPAWHGRGVGTALVRQGTDRADNEGVCFWVHASEAASVLFERCGFEEVRRLTLDLDAWNNEEIVAPEGAGAKWGEYTFRYMLREPVVAET